jgi:hypothetical protein
VGHAEQLAAVTAGVAAAAQDVLGAGIAGDEPLMEAGLDSLGTQAASFNIQHIQVHSSLHAGLSFCRGQLRMHALCHKAGL